MKKILYNIPIHSFLLAPVLIFFLFTNNYLSISFHSTIRSYKVALLVSFSIFTLLYFLFKKNKHKAGVVTTYLILILFFYGLIYEVAEKMFYNGLWPFDEIHRYLVIFILILTFVLFYFLFKTKKTFYSFTLALNVFVFIFLFINLGQLSTVLVRNNIKAPISEPRSHSAYKTSDSMPDVYYIILDGYAQDSILASQYHYKTNSLTTFLKKNNFYIASESQTNYISTLPSLSSSLNFSYLDSIESNYQLDKNRNLIYENRVSKHFKEKGYKIVHIRSGYSVSRENYFADTTCALENLGEFERTLLRYTILRLDDLLGYAQYNTLKEQLSVIHKAVDIKGPKYTFIHIVSPHPPYMCDENGNYKASKRVLNSWWEPKEDYLLQLKFVNKKIIEIISEINKKSKTLPIIILQSDHGPWAKSNSFKQLYETRSKILNTYQIPYSWKNKLYQTITPVNTFRVIFNGLFNDSFPLTKDIPLDSASVRTEASTNLTKKGKK